MRAWVILSVLSALLMSLGAAATEKRPVVLVWEVQGQRVTLDQGLRQALTTLLSTIIAEGGYFQIVPEGDLKRALRSIKVNVNLDQCVDDACKFELAREVAATKTVTTKITRMGTRCTVSAVLFDLTRAASDIAATRRRRSADGRVGGCRRRTNGMQRPRTAGAGSIPGAMRR